MQWNLKLKAPEEFQKQFPEYSSIVLQLLYDRQLNTTEDITRFFASDYETCIHDPFLMKGIKEAYERILLAIEKQEKIIVVGDYDADGVCGLTILSETLKNFGATKVKTYIPDREKEGYGLNMGIAKVVIEEQFDLVITVDCGISDSDEIQFLTEKGVEVIVIDHHLVPEDLPPAQIIINPKQKDDHYPFKPLCATGLAFKLAQALYRSGESKMKGLEKWFLDLVAIATVADIMPLRDENRVFVKYGLYVLSKTRRIGLKKLMQVARIKPQVTNSDLIVTNLNTHTIGFQIAPRINVASRMDHANISYELLSTDSSEKAGQLAENLEKKNKERQRITEEIIREIESRPLKFRDRIIFEYGEGWLAGVLGIVAGKLAERYYVPTFILSKKEKTSVGSARSIPTLNVTAAIAESKDIMDEFGGHHQAAGLTVKNENLEKLRDNLLEYINSKLKPEDFIPFLDIDCELCLEEINWSLYDELEKFAPFGEANQRPKFLIKNVIAKNISSVGNGSAHLKLILLENKPIGAKVLKAIGFGLGDWGKKIESGDRVDVVAELIMDEWNGNRELQLRIIDIRNSLM